MSKSITIQKETRILLGASSLQSLRRREIFYGLLFASPAILGFLIFTLGPMVASLFISLTDYAIVNQVKFIGLDNYRNLFDGTDQFFYKSLTVTAYYVFLSVPASIIFSFMVALLMNVDIRGRVIFRTIYYLPSIAPLIASSVIWLWLFNPDFGLLNTMLRSIGLPGSQWIYDENTVIPSLVLMSLWKTGGMMVIFLAGVQGIPSHLYEAVEVDGGNKFHQWLHITVPMMTPTIFFNLIMGLINGFQVFAQPYIMTQGGPNNASLMYVYYLYREAFTFSRMGHASAIAWILFIIISIFTVITFKMSKSWVHYEGKG